MARQSSQQAQRRLLNLAWGRGIVLAMLETAENGIALVRLWEDYAKESRGRSVNMEYTREWLQKELRDLENEIDAQMEVLIVALRREINDGQ